jgi:hypothetical protein
LTAFPRFLEEHPFGLCGPDIYIICIALVRQIESSASLKRKTHRPTHSLSLSYVFSCVLLLYDPTWLNLIPLRALQDGNRIRRPWNPCKSKHGTAGVRDFGLCAVAVAEYTTEQINGNIIPPSKKAIVKVCVRHSISHMQ